MPYQPDRDLADFIARIPKTEVHLHVEGAVDWRLVHAVDPDALPGPPPSWADDFKFPSFREFEDFIIHKTAAYFVSPERYFEAAQSIFARCAASNVHYVETSFHSGIMAWRGLDGNAVAEAILAAAPSGMEVRVFCGMLRTDRTPEVVAVLEDMLFWPNLTGVDLHGPEEPPIQNWTVDYYARAAEAGKFLKAHAGEFGPAAWVADAVDRLKVRRIQHGVRAIDDPALLQRLVEEGVTLDVCPISNVKLDIVSNMTAHPIRRLAAAGVRCTVNTDDPFIFGNTLNEEYAALAMDLGCSRRELLQFARNGWEVALVDASLRNAFLAEIDRMSDALKG